MRLVSLPVLLVFPWVCLGVTVVAAERFWGDRQPILVLPLVLLGSITVALSLSFCTLFASRKSPLKRAWICLAFMLGLELLVPLLLWLMSLPERAFERGDLKFQSWVAPSIEVTGEWQGSWTDPHQDFRQGITLFLQQDGAVITGEIRDEGGGRWHIIEGQVSGDQVNLFYGKEFAFRDRGATLLGVFKKGELVGEYFAHGRAKIGWSSRGAWQAVKVIQ